MNKAKLTKNAATVAALGTLLLADAANATVLAAEIQDTTTAEQPVLVEEQAPVEIPMAELPDETEEKDENTDNKIEDETTDVSTDEKTEENEETSDVSPPIVEVPEVQPDSVVPEEVEEDTENTEIVPLANPGVSPDGTTLDIHLSSDMSIRRANLGSFEFGDSLLDITNVPISTTANPTNNPGFTLATGPNAQPGMPNENSMAFNNLATLPITQSAPGSTWTVVHSANYNWYVVQVDTTDNLDTNGQPTQGTIMSGSVTNPNNYQVTTDQGQNGLFAAPIEGTGNATGADHTTTGTETGLRVWDSPNQSLPVGQYMIFGYPNSTVTTQVNTGGRIIFDFEVTALELSTAPVRDIAIETGLLSKTYDGTEAASRATTDTQIVNDAQLNITFNDGSAEGLTQTINFPVVDTVLNRFEFEGKDVDSWAMDYTALQGEFTTNVSAALASATNLDSTQISAIADMLWLVSDSGNGLYTGIINPRPININPGILRKTFDNTLTMRPEDFEVQPTITNLPALNSIVSPSTETFTIAEFTDASMNEIVFDNPYVAGGWQFTDASWAILLPSTELVSNYIVEVAGEVVPDFGEPEPAALNITPFAETPQHDIAVQYLFSAEIVKALGPEIMFDNGLRLAETITTTSARMGDMIALDESGAHNQLWDRNGVNPNLWSDEIDVAGNTGIQYSLYTENPNTGATPVALTVNAATTPIALSTNTTGIFTGLTPDTTYYVVAHSLESANFLAGPTTTYEFTTAAENVEAPAPDTGGQDTDSGTSANYLPQTGEQLSSLGIFGGVIAAAAGYLLWKKRKKS